MKDNSSKSTKKTKFNFSDLKLKIKNFWNNLMFPDDIKCIFCGKDILNFYNKPFCDECEKAIPFNSGRRCKICDTPIKSEATVCDYCQKKKHNFVKAFCPFRYEGKVKNLVLAYKFQNKRYLAKAFAISITNYMTEKDFDYITFVPLTKKKEKERTFNQSKLLAEEIGKILNIPVIDCFEKVRDEEKDQKLLTFAERQKNIAGLYRLKKIPFKKTDKILIVDDIITTCATVGYVSGLLKPKVDKVFACAIARTVFHNNFEYVPKSSAKRTK